MKMEPGLSNFTVSDLMLLLDKGKMKVTKIKKELQEHGLLREVRQGPQ